MDRDGPKHPSVQSPCLGWGQSAGTGATKAYEMRRQDRERCG